MGDLLWILLLRSIPLALGGLAVLWLLRKKAASVRHAVGATVVFGLLALPILFASVPKQTVPVPMPVVRLVPSMPQVVSNASVPMPAAPATAVPATRRLAQIDSVRLLGGVWLAGVLLLLGQIAVGIGRLNGWYRRSVPMRVPEGDGLEVRVSVDTPVPMTAWLGRHIVLLPQESQNWEESRVRSALLHEIAHIRRRDWFVQLAGRFMCVLFWPNPLVWKLDRTVRDLAEQAADDHVLAQGVAPSAYANDLLQIARELRGARTASLVLPMAQKADVTRRIQNVLSSKKHRGAVGLTSLLICLGVLVALVLPTAGFVLTRVKFVHLGGVSVGLQDRYKTSPYADVRDGKTVSGSEDNGFTAKFADGRKAKLVHIARKTSTGIEVWRPDGTPLPLSNALVKTVHGDNPRTLQFCHEVQSDTVDGSLSFGMGSGLPDPGGPSRTTFAGGWSLPATRSGWRTVVGLIEVGDVGSTGKDSYSFGGADGPFQHYATIHFDAKGKATSDARVIENLRVVYPHATKTWMRDGAGKPIRDKQGKNPMHTVDATMIAFHVPESHQYHDIEVRAVDRTGRPVELEINDLQGTGKGRDDKWYYRRPTKELSRIDIRMRPNQNVYFEGVHLRPKTSATP